jgi:pimeloyl-ACP methyl ester carboxylesterase
LHSITRAFGVALVSGTLVLSVPASGQAAQISAIDWKPCPQDVTAECGTLRLPIDYSKPSGEKFDLAVARRKAADPAKRVGVLLVNPGGPGDSGVDMALSLPPYVGADFRERFDIVGWDPRGVARSRPVMCSTDLLANPPTSYPANQAEFDALGKYNRDLLDDCRKRSGPIADHADTGATVQDMDAIRRALGEQKISYYGMSYGTLMGQQYAERYGDKIRDMVLDSNMDHSLGTWGFAATAAISAQSSFTEWVKWCDRTTSCALHGQDVVKAWESLLAKADRGEVSNPGNPAQKIDARGLAREALGAFIEPDFGPLAEIVAQLTGQLTGQQPAKRAAQGEANAVFHAAFCSDWSLPVRTFAEYKALEAAETALAPDLRGVSRGHNVAAACVGLPEKVSNPQHRLDIRNAPKILMLNSLYDPATPYSWAANAHRQSKDTTVLLTYEGWGHGVYGRSECTTASVDTYLTTLKTPKPGARCAPVQP